MITTSNNNTGHKRVLSPHLLRYLCDDNITINNNKYKDTSGYSARTCCAHWATHTPRATWNKLVRERVISTYLPRRLPPPEILDLFAPRHWAVRARAALGVQVQEEPHLLAQGAAASDLLLAAHGMLEQLAHLRRAESTHENNCVPFKQPIPTHNHAGSPVLTGTQLATCAANQTLNPNTLNRCTCAVCTILWILSHEAHSISTHRQADEGWPIACPNAKNGCAHIQTTDLTPPPPHPHTLQQGPDSSAIVPCKPTHPVTPKHTHTYTHHTPTHLAAGAGLALQVVAAARMHQQRHRLLQLLAALPPLRIREPHACLVVVAAGLGHEGVLVAARVLAVGADVKVVALVAVPARAWLHVNVTQVAAAGKGGGVGVVGVVQDHHGAVLRAPQCVKLVVVALAQVQEGLRVRALGRGWGGFSEQGGASVERRQTGQSPLQSVSVLLACFPDLRATLVKSTYAAVCLSLFCQRSAAYSDIRAPCCISSASLTSCPRQSPSDAVLTAAAAAQLPLGFLSLIIDALGCPIMAIMYMGPLLSTHGCHMHGATPGLNCYLC
eukprot:1159118-Pelagomonas_calceolata.AAC.10